MTKNLNLYEGISVIIDLLDEKRLREAITQLKALTTQSNDWQLQEAIKELETSYLLMLKYTRQGMKDPNKPVIFRRLLRTAYELTDRANIALTNLHPKCLYNEMLLEYAQKSVRTYNDFRKQLETYTQDMATAPLFYTDKEQCQRMMDKISDTHETALIDLFNRTWASTFWSETDANEAQDLLHSVLVQANDLAVLVSAVTMNLLHVFDARKFLFLFEAYRHADLYINQRAIVGIVLLTSHYDQRLQLYPEILAQFQLLEDDATFIEDVMSIQMQLLICRETQKIDKKMQEEILPKVIKKTQNFEFDFSMHDGDEDFNPEWSEADNDELHDEIREIGEWQTEGADIYMGTFAPMKKFPFFDSIAHWFYPFDSRQKHVVELFGGHEAFQRSPLSLLLSLGAFCDSDKYSLCYIVGKVPKQMQDMMVQQIGDQLIQPGGQNEQLDEVLEENLEADTVCRQYIFDLYRFFKLWKRNKEEIDLFATNRFNLWNIQPLQILFDQEELLQLFADYLLQKDYLQEALTLYDRLKDMNPGVAKVWQKAGFILQKEKRYEEAIHYYQHADFIASNDTWTNRHLAQCYRKTGDMQQALAYYKKVEAALPNDLNLALQIGQCLVNLKQYDQALAYFYKVEYLEKNPNNARRAIGWCSFITGKLEDAKKYYALLLESENVRMQDWMNAGHVYFVSGDLENTYTCYRRAQALCSSHKEFLTSYMEDKKELLAQGVCEEDICVMLDGLV